MMRQVLLLLTLTFSMAVFAQGDGPLLKSSDKGLYIEHKVVAKDNFYSIGRQYNANAKEIAAFNKLDMNKGLNIGQTVRIPLNASNFSQAGTAGIPVYYKLGEKEGLMKASSTANNVTLEKLRKWNKLENDKVEPGSKLIVGYLVNATQAAAQVKEPVVATPVKEEKKVVTETVVNQQPKVDKPVVTETPKNPVKDLTTDVPAKTETPKNPANDLNTDVPAKTETPKKPEPKIEPLGPTASDEGYFRTSFEKQMKISPVSHLETVTSGIFKTTSGWMDAKYYVLMDGVISGTIVKVINPVNNKAVYAKVLGEMSGIRQNEGLNIRVSSAAASALQITESEKFVLKVNY